MLPLAQARAGGSLPALHERPGESSVGRQRFESTPGNAKVPKGGGACDAEPAERCDRGEPHHLWSEGVCRECGLSACSTARETFGHAVKLGKLTANPRGGEPEARAV